MVVINCLTGWPLGDYIQTGDEDPEEEDKKVGECEQGLAKEETIDKLGLQP